MPFILRYPVRVSLTILFLLLATTLSLIIPLLLGSVIDEAFVTQNIDKLVQYGLVIVIVVTIMSVASGARYYFMSIIGEKVLADLRRAVFDHLLFLDVSFFDVHRVGELTSRLNGDVATIRSAIGFSVSVALRSIVMLVGAIIMMAITSPKLTLIVVIIGPLVVIPIIIFVRRLRKMSRITQDKLADISAIATETLSSIKTVKAFVQEEVQKAIFANSSKESYQAEARRLFARSFLVALVMFMASVAMLIVVWYGASAVFAGEVSEGQLVQFLIYALMAAGAIINMSDIWGTLQTLAGATERLIEILQTKPKISDPKNPQKLPKTPRGEVEFDNVSFSYHTRANDIILDSVSFSVERGKRVALVGPSGSGKSTIFSLLHRFYEVNKGRILVDGKDIKKVKMADLRSHFAYVEQESIIFSGTIADNIRFARPNASDEEIREAAKAALVDEFVDRLEDGYETMVGERGLMLSGGQKQRIAIARALLKDAPILLLDEATSALDAHSEHLVQQALEHLMQGRTTIIIAHRLATIRDADKILVLEGGKLIDSGTHEELIKKGGHYARLAKLQFRQDS